MSSHCDIDNRPENVCLHTDSKKTLHLYRRQIPLSLKIVEVTLEIQYTALCNPQVIDECRYMYVCLGRGGGGRLGDTGLVTVDNLFSNRRNLGLFAPTSMRFPSKDSKLKDLSF